MNTSKIGKIPAIDMHCHYGEWKEKKDVFEEQNGFSTSLSAFLKQCESSNTALSVVSHLGTLFPPLGGKMEANRKCLEEIREESHVLMLATLNPLWEGSFENVRELYKDEKCFGIKIHPTMHGYQIKDWGEKIYRFAAELGAPIITHTGEECCLPADFLPFADEFPEVVTDLSHMCYSVTGDSFLQIRAVQASKHGNLYTDTSSRAMLGVDRMERAIFELGYDHVFYGTDAGAYFSPAQRARLDYAELPDEAKEAILYKNAVRVFPKLASAYEKAKAVPIC